MKSAISFVFVLMFSLTFFVNDCLADKLGKELNNNISEQSNTKDFKNNKNTKNDIPKVSNEDIFGDEQAFPFIAGLGKNAAH